MGRRVLLESAHDIDIHGNQENVCGDPRDRMRENGCDITGGADKSDSDDSTSQKFKQTRSHSRYAVAHALNGIAEYKDQRKRRIEQRTEAEKCRRCADNR